MKPDREFPFPRISVAEAARLPRERSRGDDPDSGRCLIALRYVGPRTHRKVVIIRNCYRRIDDPIVVENIREYMFKALRTGRQGVSLRRLMLKPHQRNVGNPAAWRERGYFEIVKPPFMLEEPMHDCMLEIRADRFDAIWEANHSKTRPSCTEEHVFQPEETPLQRHFRNHWFQHKVGERWTGDRIRRLCALWNLTPYELAEMINWTAGGMNKALAENRPDQMRLPGPVAVWFYFLENFRLGVSVFPSFEPQAQEAKAS